MSAKRGGFFKPDFFELVAVDSLDLKLKKHETLGLVGETGSGKTTFGQALIRLIGNQGGEIFFDGEAIHTKDRRAMRPLRSRMQIVFQDPFASLNPRMSVRQIIEEGLIVNNLGGNSRALNLQDWYSRVPSARARWISGRRCATRRWPFAGCWWWHP